MAISKAHISNFLNDNAMRKMCLLFALFVCLLVLLGSFFSLSNNDLLLSDELKNITNNVRGAFQKKPDYRGLDNTYAIENNIVSKSLVRNGKIFSRSRSQIIIGRDETGKMLRAGDNFFTISYKNLNMKKCVVLASTNFDVSDGLVQIVIQNNAETVFAYGQENNLPVTKERVQQACRSDNIVSFRFE